MSAGRKRVNELSLARIPGDRELNDLVVRAADLKKLLYIGEPSLCPAVKSTVFYKGLAAISSTGREGVDDILFAAIPGEQKLVDNRGVTTVGSLR